MGAIFQTGGWMSDAGCQYMNVEQGPPLSINVDRGGPLFKLNYQHPASDI